MKKLLALFMCLTIIASCASVSICAAEIENLAGGPFNFENDNNAPFTRRATVVDKTAAGVDFVTANGSKVLKLSGNSDIKFSESGINSGIIEFTTDWYACNLDTSGKLSYGVAFGIGSQQSMNLFRLVKNTTGAVAGANGGWSLTGGNNNVIPLNQWVTLKITVNVDGDNSWYEVAYKVPGADDSTYKNFNFQHSSYKSGNQIYYEDYIGCIGKNPSELTGSDLIAYNHAKEMADNTIYTYEKRYYLDGVVGYQIVMNDGKVKQININNNQKILSDINKITFDGNVKNNLYDNTSVKVYEPFYTAINKCTTADEVKAQLKLYKNLGIFDFGSEYTKVDDMNTVFSALIGQSFGSDAAVTNAYNAAVAANVNPYISERIVMDDLTESPVFSKGSLVTNTTIKPDGKFYMPAYGGTAGVNFANPVKKDGIIKFKSDVYVHYDNATRITPFSIRMGSNDNAYSGAGVAVASITRSGSFATASSAWTGDVSVKDNNWTNIEYLVDTEAESLRIKSDGKEAIMPISYNDYETSTITNSYVYKYTGETVGGVENANNMGVIPDTVYGLRFTHGENGGKDTSLDYLANTDITVYKPLYKVINESTDAESFAKAIDFYSSNLNVFTKSDKAYSAKDLYTALGGKTYNNSKEFVDAYNKYVSALSLNPGVIGYNDKKTSINYISVEVNTTNVTIKEDDVSYIALYAADGSLNGVYELPRITNEKTTGDGQRTYTYGDGITLVNWDAAITGETVVISKYNWDKAVTAKVFIWSKDSEGSAIIPVANSVKIK